MNPQVKKKLFAILPYALIFLLAAKLGQGFRLAPGADIGARILHLSDGIKAALASFTLSPSDLLVGAMGTLFFRMAIFAKKQNTRKYRHGVEYGSARWSA